MAETVPSSPSSEPKPGITLGSTARSAVEEVDEVTALRPGTHFFGPFQRAMVSPVETPSESSGSAGTGTRVWEGTASLPLAGPTFATRAVSSPERSLSARPRPPSVFDVETAVFSLRVLMLAAARPTRRSTTLPPSMPGVWSSTIARSTWEPTLARWWDFCVPFFLPARAASASVVALADIGLFGDMVNVEVVADPKMVAVATGRPGKAKITYTPAVLEITGPDGSPVPIPTDGAPAEIGIPTNPLLGLTIQFPGIISEKVTDNGRMAKAKSVTLRLVLSLAGQVIADVAVAPLQTKVKVPKGGITC